MTIVAPLLLTSGLTKYEARLHSNFVVFLLYVYAKGCMQGAVWIEPNKCEYDVCGGTSLVCGGACIQADLG